MCVNLHCFLAVSSFVVSAHNHLSPYRLGSFIGVPQFELEYIYREKNTLRGSKFRQTCNLHSFNRNNVIFSICDNKLVIILFRAFQSKWLVSVVFSVMINYIFNFLQWICKINFLTYFFPKNILVSKRNHKATTMIYNT